MTRFEKMDFLKQIFGDRVFLFLYISYARIAGPWNILKARVWCAFVWHIRRRNPITGEARG